MNKARETVEYLCSVFGNNIEDSFLESVNHYYELHREELLDISPSTKAALINDYIYLNFKKCFQDVGGFEFIKKKNFRFIGYDCKILIRIKKLNKARKPAINKTHASEKFNIQANMGLLENAQATNVYLGYVINHESGNIDQVAFVCPNEEGSIAWTIDVTEQAIQKDLDFNIIPITPETDSKPGRLRPKNPKRKKENEQ
ncbi:MAG: hypothetical protein LBQ88_00460 [Treponema sp.]|jgi:hypothetical protein|nr:hypothetical protein [Treponema sp.]